jgi:hypothetical protein
MFFSVSALDLAEPSYLVVVTVQTEFVKDISGCVHSVFTCLIPNKVQQQTVDVVTHVDTISGVLICLGAMWKKITVDNFHIKVCVLAGDLHISMFHVGEKFLSPKPGSFQVFRSEEINLKEP